MSYQHPAENAAQLRTAVDPPLNGSAPVTTTKPMTGLIAGARNENVANSSYTDSSTSVPLYAPKTQPRVHELPTKNIEQTTTSTVSQPLVSQPIQPANEVDHTKSSYGALGDTQMSNVPMGHNASNTIETRSGGYNIADGRAYHTNSTGVNTAAAAPANTAAPIEAGTMTTTHSQGEHQIHNSHNHSQNHGHHGKHPHSHADRETIGHNYRTVNPERPNEGSTIKTHIDSWAKKSLYGGPNTKTHYHTDSTSVAQFPITRAGASTGNIPSAESNTPLATDNSLHQGNHEHSTAPLQSFSTPAEQSTSSIGHDHNLYNKENRVESTEYIARDERHIM